ncbi:hypothetical protein H6F77_01460 [Microcoleus sp. FACHB-831]|uniref:hypothetical protein n=1 Tax=Microcoleus sp. FACHB-831 TaxID=2692827 RepID=UPI001683CFD0|nr:hypothetical protein [Microcoleus sp. FACHB-831]MBD1919787.1 hypothetical protein [Microcoleus sp. FACHB-831]
MNLFPDQATIRLIECNNAAIALSYQALGYLLINFINHTGITGSPACKDAIAISSSNSISSSDRST